MADQKVIEFVKNLLIHADLSVDDADYVNELAEEVEKRLGLTVLNELPEEHLEEYQKIISQGDVAPEVSAEFFKKHIPDFEQKMQEALKTFAIDFVTRANKFKETLS